uniref:Uncharacterized protein n=1 Tax=Meloidogyne enterolobii TaxID=390850 RepID=A0A6V7UWR3_MELEN|nr:unnamed protein product [Meloidogyne enterolobii]
MHFSCVEIIRHFSPVEILRNRDFEGIRSIHKVSLSSSHLYTFLTLLLIFFS